MKYEILCNTSNKDYYYMYLDKYEVKDLEYATKKIIDLETKILKNEKFDNYKKIDNLVFS